MMRIAVIGAGPAGCAAAWVLAEAGHDVVLFEKSEHVGGRTRTDREHGPIIDTGAGFFTNFYPTLERYIDALGLREHVVTLSRSNWLTYQGRQASFSVGSARSAATMPFLGVRSKARMAFAGGLVVARYRGVDFSDPESLAPLDDRSIRDDALERFGEEVYQFLVRPAIEPFWYFSCRDVSRALMLSLMAKGVTAHFFALRDGMDSVCRVVAQRVDTRTGCAVEALDAGPHVSVSTAQGSERFDRVVVATTASVADRLTGRLKQEFVPPQMGAFLASQRYVPNIHVAYLVPRSNCLPEMTALFPCGPHNSKVAALNFASHKRQNWSDVPEDAEVLCVYLTAGESARKMGLGDEALFESAWAHAKDMCPTLRKPLRNLAIFRREEAIPLHAVGRYRLAAAAAAAQRAPIVFAGDYLASATVDGALRSGDLAARVILRS